jgi:maltose O-acetyltransferase
MHVDNDLIGVSIETYEVLLFMWDRFKKILVNDIASMNIVPTKLRKNIYAICGMKIDTQAIWPGCYFSGFNLRIGKGTWINRGCHFDNDLSLIEIGENCGIGMEVMFCTSSHKIGNSEKRAGENIKQSIIIDKGCWIGTRSTILPGVTIGKGCVVAAGSIVNKNCEPNGLYAGVPAKRIKELL